VGSGSRRWFASDLLACALVCCNPANAAARRDGWPKVLEFLDRL